MTYLTRTQTETEQLGERVAKALPAGGGVLALYGELGAGKTAFVRGLARGLGVEDEIVSHDSDGSFNENYCKWCYADGTYTYSNMDDLIDVCVKHLVSEGFSEEQARAHMKATLPKLDYWKRYEELSDNGQFEMFKEQLIREINDLQIEGMPKVEKLNALVGSYVNLPYPLPSGANVKFLNDQTTYLGTQLECEFGGDRCFGVLANMDFIMICTYEADGENPELVLYKKR